VKPAVRCKRVLGVAACLSDNILGKSLKPLSVCLFDGDCNVARFAGLDISYGARFACMCSADNCTALAFS
jgi:hypothetical protein